MEDLIRFMSRTNELDDKEYLQFISKCITSQSDGKKLFSKLLFNHFKNSPHSITPFTNIAINIINAREKQSEQEISSKCLDALPSAIIGECGSFLCELDYFRFGKVNRNIYLGCYSPCKLYSFYWWFFEKHPPSLSMRRFKFVKELSINIPHFINNLSALNQSMWQINHLNVLELDNYSKNQEGDVINFTNFKNKIESSNITKLTMRYFGTDRYPLESTIFFKLLFHFSNIKHLDIHDVYLTNDHKTSDDEIRKSLPNLTSLTAGCWLEDDELIRLIIHALGHQLELLSISDVIFMQNNGNIISSNGFPKLQELELIIVDSSNNYPEILDSFKNVNSLKKATADFGSDVYDVFDFRMMVQQFIQQTIGKSLSLEYLKLNIQDVSLQTVMKHTEIALFRCKDIRKSKHLYVEFEIHHIHRCEMMDEMDLQTVRLVSSLEAKFDDFKMRACVYFGGDRDISESIKKSVNRLLNELQNMKQKYCVDIEKWSQNNLSFIICRKH